MKRIVVNEWLWILTTPGPERRSPVSIRVENVAPRDRALVSALVEIARIWLNSTRRLS